MAEPGERWWRGGDGEGGEEGEVARLARRVVGDGCRMRKKV